jgi:hypothetical protein
MEAGERLDLWIAVPVERESWMRYTAEVVRNETVHEKVGLAVKFDGMRPIFCDELRS